MDTHMNIKKQPFWEEFTGSDRDGLNFLHSSQQGAAFWICVWNSVDNTQVFRLLLSSACTASKLYFAPLCPPLSRLGMDKNLGRHKAGTANTSWPKGCSRPYNMLSNKSWSRRRRWGFNFQGICYSESACV